MKNNFQPLNKPSSYLYSHCEYVIYHTSMAVISKQAFYAKFGMNTTCQQLFHPEVGCLQENFKLFTSYSRGVFYFYLPIYIIKTMINYKKIDKNYIKSQLKDYLWAESYGCTMGLLTVFTLCASSKIFGGLRYYNVGFLPGFMGGLAILLETPDQQFLNSIIWCSMVIEALLQNLHFFKVVNLQGKTQTFLFVLSNSILMHLLAHRQHYKVPKNIWFYDIGGFYLKGDGLNCNHDRNNIKTPCGWYCIKESSKYFALGYALSCARKLIGNASKYWSTRSLPYSLLFNRGHVKFAALLGTYVGLFRGISCILYKYGKGLGKGGDFSAAIAGGIAGVAYHINPSLSILSVAITWILYILSKNAMARHKSLAHLPFPCICFILSNSILFHNRMCLPDTCPKYYSNTLELASAGFFNELYTTYTKKYALV